MMYTGNGSLCFGGFLQVDLLDEVIYWSGVFTEMTQWGRVKTRFFFFSGAFEHRRGSRKFLRG